MHIAEVEVEEPMWLYLDFLRRVDREQWFIEHPIDIREITGVALNSPKPLRSMVAQRMAESGILSTRMGTTSLLEIEFDDSRRNQIADFRPHFPPRLSILIARDDRPITRQRSVRATRPDAANQPQKALAGG